MAVVLLQLTWLLDDNGIPANWANMVCSLACSRVICSHLAQHLIGPAWKADLHSLLVLHLCSSAPPSVQEGYGVNTFKLINAEGQENLCKFHVLPKEGRVDFL